MQTDDLLTQVLVRAVEVKENDVVDRELYRLEAWPALLPARSWVDIGGNDEQIESYHLRRTAENQPYILVWVPIVAGNFENLLNDKSWRAVPEHALDREPF